MLQASSTTSRHCPAWDMWGWTDDLQKSLPTSVTLQIRAIIMFGDF